MPAIYGNAYQIVQGPGLGRDPLRDDPRSAHHPARRPAARRQGHQAGHGRRARPLGGRHAGRRDDELHEAKRRTATATPRRSSSSSVSSRGHGLVEWSVTINDSTTWTRPWTFAMNLTRGGRASSRSSTPATKATTAWSTRCWPRARPTPRQRLRSRCQKVKVGERNHQKQRTQRTQTDARALWVICDLCAFVTFVVHDSSSVK